MQQAQTNCINCKRSFQQGQTLPPEGIYIEYKKYYLPIKDHQPKWILLKTIVAFLNSKGGTIFMGVDDATREVVGLTAQLKQQDMFMLDFGQLLENIQPQVDLRRKEQVKIRFIPVLNEKSFQGKWIIKIIVKQGDPSKVYHFAQTLRFINQDRKHHDEDFKVLWGFYRSNMGKVDALKGTQLLRQVYQKAKNPSIIAQTFHPGCNPQPLQVSVRNMNIGFKNLRDSQLKKKILDCIQRKFKALNLQTTYSIEQTQQDNTVILKFKSITDYKKADSCIIDNEKEFSAMIEGKDAMLDEGFIDNTHFYKIGQSFNPSLRYLRNRQRSRNRSIQIVDKKSTNKPNLNEVKSPLPQHQTRFKPKQVEEQQEQKQQEVIVTKPKGQFIKNLPKQEIQQPEEEQQEQQQIEQVNDQSQQNKPSPVKKFQAKPQQFPQLNGNQVTSKSKNSTKKSQQTLVKILPPKSIVQTTQLSPIKQTISKRQNSQQKVNYSITISNIFEKSYAKVINYLQHSLGTKLQKIPHKIQQKSNSLEVIIHFHSLRDIDSFAEELSQNLHHKQLLNGFGDGKTIKISVKKGNNTENLKWIDDHHESNQVNKLNGKLKNQETPKKQSNESPAHIYDKSPNGKIVPPAQILKQKLKIKFQDIKGFPFVISNLRTDLQELQKTHLGELLREIFKQFCSENAKVQIVNEKSFIGIIDLNFENAEERKRFADLMQIQIIKYHELTDFFKGHRAFWGVPSGNIILHHYKADSKKQFKEQIDKLFPQDGTLKLISSKYMKQDNKYFLSVVFHPNNLVQGLQRIYENVVKSPIKDYATSKEGIIIIPQVNKI